MAILLAMLAGPQCMSPISDPTIPLTTVEAQPKVRLQTSKGDIVLELFPRQAPKTVDEFLRHVRYGFYNGTVIHQVDPSASIAAGLYNDALSPKVALDPVPNESNNGLSNLRGRVALFEPDGSGTGSSGFMIHIADRKPLDFNLDTGQLGTTVFGQVVEGMDVADAIAQLSTTTKQTTDGKSLNKYPGETVTILHAALEPDPSAPVANAGTDQNVQVRDVVILNGSASADPNGQALAFSWRQTAGPPVTLSRTDVVSPNFTADGVARLKFELAVTNEQGATGTASVNVVVNTPGNQPPIAYAGPIQIVQARDTVTLDGSGSSDPDVQGITFLWTQTAGTPVTLNSPVDAKPTFTAPTSADTLAFRLDVTDTFGAQASDSVTILVNQGRLADAGDDQNVLTDETVTLHGSVRDHDYRGFTFAWTQTSGTTVTLSSTTVAEPTFTAPAQSSQLVFRLTVADDLGTTWTDTVTISVYTETSSGLRYCDVVKGTGTLVEPTSTVKALYTGRLNDQNGKIFDSTSLRGNKPSEFPLSGVIEGWKEGLGKYDMRAGGKRLLIIPPDLGYGSQGKGEDIPPDSTLWFEVEVKSVK